MALYEAPQRLVEENDRRLDMENADEIVDVEFTEECIRSKHVGCRVHAAHFHSEERRIRAYRKLTYQLPSIKKIVDKLEADELQLFFKSVRSSDDIWRQRI